MLARLFQKFNFEGFSPISLEAFLNGFLLTCVLNYKLLLIEVAQSTQNMDLFIQQMESSENVSIQVLICLWIKSTVKIPKTVFPFSPRPILLSIDTLFGHRQLLIVALVGVMSTGNIVLTLSRS